MGKKEKFEYLTALYFAHVKTFPYHNFELRKIGQQHPLNRQSITLFDYKNLMNLQTGGYCYQNARLLFNMLIELGFSTECCESYTILGHEVNDADIVAKPPTHMILLVTLGTQKFFLDPGMGAYSLRFPIPITDHTAEFKQQYDLFRSSKQQDFFVIEKYNSKITDG
ncbi:TPA: arylamine N-acetyltransferase [Legionella pneumophila]|nr:arylamine N-acetyltransferase [Legionella pneumophila]HAT1761277.1 arylamine N-acetyltransferase [Legionella pneumophila]HAT1763293.1 arylamine N-acetyltransferase [Legionella pneumophila]HAT1766362.1 arylamine N-acetyltransferase [Legionella pneumophila]HAT1812203.1 arylamine N-acetyltransferase [Legionella pneumophila]